MPDSTPPTSDTIRQHLVDALHLDLVGPPSRHPLADEQLHRHDRPSSWYLTGFLIPSGSPPEETSDVDEGDDLDVVHETTGLVEESTEEGKAAKKGYFPSSMGLSFLVSKDTGTLDVTIRWGDYTRDEVDVPGQGPKELWQRHPREVSLPIPVGGSADVDTKDVPGSDGLQLQVVQREIPESGLGGRIPAGTRSVSLFLVNRRTPDADLPDRAYAFQAELEVRAAEPFVPRPDPRGALAEDWDEEVADLHYADTPEYATGHGISADWDVVDGRCHRLCTTWIPGAEVEKTATVEPGADRPDQPQVELSMETLGALTDGEAVAAALRPLVDYYREWIAGRDADAKSIPGDSPRETAELLVKNASLAATRIETGIELLGKDPLALDAFRVANRAVARALRKRLDLDVSPRWRSFQLAFFLLNLPGIADPADVHRETVDLLFFPTGGGKTEAYLGLAAFAMVLRRLRHPDETGVSGAGVSVIMRYTLRLLTLDQLQRAAGLVCALELERGEAPDTYGTWPFEIGLWVGKAATPNVLGYKGEKGSDSARAKVRRFQNDPGSNPAPIPLESCPWCNTRFAPDSFTLLPNADQPREMRIVCADFACEFSADRPLPIVAVDEPIYRRLPAFLIATADKFAALPWTGPSGVLLGGADRHDAHGFYGAAEPGHGRRLPAPLPPPDLIVQDELHLIAGPLGTMAGLYEAAIEALCQREIDGRTVRPKIVASTATVRRAQDQIQALFGRSSTQVFPPPGPDRRDSFFARVVPTTEAAARRYLGVAAQGRNPKVILRRVWLALMGAAERAYREAGGHGDPRNPADPYMTVLGYFNSLRELGGARRILEEEVQNTIKSYGERTRVRARHPLFESRKTFSEVVELTSRVSTAKVAEARRRLETTYHDKQQRVDCALATNMISVGLDIPRLGLMVVVGQPKTHAEYIQATSRVGRDDKRPGLVVTLLSIHKPRDRSHYERFRHYHETFYRSVEVASVTPFSARALDRGFAGALVALARHLMPELTTSRGVERLVDVRAALEERLLEIFLDRIRRQPIVDEAEREERLRSVQNRIVDLLDSWQKVVDDYRGDGVAVQYQKYEEKTPKPLLREMLDTDFEDEHHRKFRANRSLRDVEPSVNLFLKDLNGRDVEVDR